jgi:hypothetical protein
VTTGNGANQHSQQHPVSHGQQHPFPKRRLEMITKVYGFIVAFLACGMTGLLLRFIGPVIGGGVVILFNLSPSPSLAQNLESAGNIFGLIVSIYVGVKVYKKIVVEKY